MPSRSADIFPELAAPECAPRSRISDAVRAVPRFRMRADKLVVLTAFASGMLAVLILL